MDHQKQKCWGSSGSADTEELEFITVDQQARMSRSHGDQPARMSLSLCRYAGMDEF